jgi:AraC-like DNA-binding protein
VLLGLEEGGLGMDQGRLAESAVDLSRDSIARAHFISKSYLDKLFDAKGTSVWQSIKERRLDRCRCDLQDESLAHESILEIASRWGFTSAAHFSRTFAATFGISPREYRSASRGACEPRPEEAPRAPCEAEPSADPSVRR